MKRLIVCCDGTWNELSRYPTNVAKLAQAVQRFDDQGTAQIVYYQPGLGTRWSERIMGGAFGWGIDENIKAAYEFLCFNYEPGDEIYLFGFSRGAYTVRSLAGMIYCAGLLKLEQVRKVDEAYKIYRERNYESRCLQAEQFRVNNGTVQVPITVLGCWDTVGSLGVPDLVPFLPFSDVLNQRYRFHDETLNPKIQVALHAVAIDERRKVFDVTPMHRSEQNADQIVRQVWFPGNHGCVGGGTEKHRGLSDNALLWMINSMANFKLGLQFKELTSLLIDPTIDFDSSPGIFRFAGLHHRTVAEVDPQTQQTSPAVLHSSVKQRWLKRPDYRRTAVNLQPYATQLNGDHASTTLSTRELSKVA